MNITEAVRTQSLLAWVTDPDPRLEATGIAIVDARYLAERAHQALGAGPDADQVETAIRRRLTDQPDTDDRLVRLADLLTPCRRPAIEDGWDLCAHAERWPCVITRAAWIAAGQAEQSPDRRVGGQH